jgi:4-hydroxybenzoate polyprenyltransferase
MASSYSFYSYAHQDKVDDAKLGLKSTALYFGNNTKPILHGFAACAGMGWLAACQDLHPVSFVGLGSSYAHLVWQIQTADLNSPSNLAYRFRSNQTVGGLVFLSIVAGNVL